MHSARKNVKKTEVTVPTKPGYSRLVSARHRFSRPSILAQVNDGWTDGRSGGRAMAEGKTRKRKDGFDWGRLPSRSWAGIRSLLLPFLELDRQR